MSRSRSPANRQKHLSHPNTVDLFLVDMSPDTVERLIIHPYKRLIQKNGKKNFRNVWFVRDLSSEKLENDFHVRQDARILCVAAINVSIGRSASGSTSKKNLRSLINWKSNSRISSRLHPVRTMPMRVAIVFWHGASHVGDWIEPSWFSAGSWRQSARLSCPCKFN